MFFFIFYTDFFTRHDVDINILPDQNIQVSYWPPYIQPSGGDALANVKAIIVLRTALSIVTKNKKYQQLSIIRAFDIEYFADKRSVS